MIRLGVNVDHVATVRQARQISEPDPVHAAAMAELGGADGITIHLREDRRHIQDRDLRILRETVKSRLNLELALAEDVLALAEETLPDQITLVPEKREEVTTEGGLDVTANAAALSAVVQRFSRHGVEPTIFIDAVEEQVRASGDLGFVAVEFNTGAYANASGDKARVLADEIGQMGELAGPLGMAFHAGHGLNTLNVRDIARLNGLAELNIGHSIVARALFIGFEAAVREMKKILESYGV